MPKRVALVLACIVGGWLLFDGLRAWFTGHYTTVSRGPDAGRLGPWARLLEGAGLNPTSRAVMALHIVLGLLWLVAAARLVQRPSSDWSLLVVAAVATLWYLPAGTAIGLAVLALAYFAAKG